MTTRLRSFGAMMRWPGCLLGIFLATVLLAEDELPKEPETSFEVEPQLLMPDQPDRREPGNEPAPEQIAASLEKAKKRAAASERLFRSGVIAKVEAENRALEVVRLEADLERAQLQRASADLAAQQARLAAGDITAEELERAKTELVQATAAARAAVARRDQAELDAALKNLQRQKKLLSLGSARPVDVNRAAEKVAALQQPKK